MVRLISRYTSPIYLHTIGDIYSQRDAFDLVSTVTAPCGAATFLNINSDIRVSNVANTGGVGYILNDDVCSIYSIWVSLLKFLFITEQRLVEAGLSLDIFYKAQLLTLRRDSTSSGADAEHKRTHLNPRNLDWDLLFSSLSLSVLKYVSLPSLVRSLEISCKTHVDAPTYAALPPTQVSKFKLAHVLPLSAVAFSQTTKSRTP